VRGAVRETTRGTARDLEAAGGPAAG
jgi:hypothetical protein